MAIRDHALFRRVDHPGPDVAKGGCYFSYDTGPGVDTGILVEFEGTLFFSLNTIKELAEVAGFSVNDEAIQLEQDNANLEELVAFQKQQIEELTHMLETIGVAAAVAHSKSAK